METTLPKRTWYFGTLRFFKLFYIKFDRDEIPHRSAAVAFNLVLSIFPATLFLFSLIPYIPIPNLEVHIMNFLEQAMPKGIYEESTNTIHDIISKPKANLLSIGFILTL